MAEQSTDVQSDAVVTGEYVQVATLPPPGRAELFGYSVSVSGGTIVIGAPDGGFNGLAYVYTEPPNGWQGDDQQPDAKLVPLTDPESRPDDAFGTAVAAWQDTIVLGGAGGSTIRGGAHVFNRPAAGWATTPVMEAAARLLRQDGTTGQLFGSSVAIERDSTDPGETIVVGAPGLRGMAYVYRKSSTTKGWHGDLYEAAQLTRDDGFADDQFGTSVGISRSRIAVGAPDPGLVAIYDQPSNGWNGQRTPDTLLVPAAGEMVTFGWSLDIKGQMVVASAPEGDGSLRVFQVQPGASRLTERARLTAPSPDEALGVGQFGVSFDGGDARVISAGMVGAAADAYVWHRPITGMWGGTLKPPQSFQGVTPNIVTASSDDVFVLAETDQPARIFRYQPAA